MEVTRSLIAADDLLLHLVTGPGFPDMITLVSVVQTGWTAFGSMLRSLTLNITSGGCEYALSTDLTLPQLEDLVIHLDGICQHGRHHGDA